jgi:hypothetical protein
MKISSNYYDYSLISLANILANKNTAANTASSDSAQESTNVTAVSSASSASSASRKKSDYMTNDNYMDFSYSGHMVSNSVQNQIEDSSVVSEKVQKVKEDIDSIKTADIDSMTADEVKDLLTNLQNDRKALQISSGISSSSQETDIDSMSESDMRETLKNVQNNAKNASKMGGGKPPMGPPPGPPPSSNDTSETDETDDEIDTSEEYLELLEDEDIDNMSSDEVKETLTNIQNSLKSINGSEDETASTDEADIDAMSETDMKEFLKEVQNAAKNSPETGGEKPPMGPPPGPPPSSNGTSETDENNDEIETLEEYLELLEDEDVDNMSSDEVEELLINLQNSIKASISSDDSTVKTEESDISSLSESDMKDILRNFQSIIKSDQSPVMWEKPESEDENSTVQILNYIFNNYNSSNTI